jgi:hypothetical protein
MEENYGDKLVEVFDKYSGSEYESKVSAHGDIIEIEGRPEGIRLQIGLLIFFLAVPVVALIEDRSVLIVFFSSLWLIFFGRIFIEVTKADLFTRIILDDRTVEIANINPLMKKFKKMFRFRFAWEGKHQWSQFDQVVLREKKFGRAISNRGYRLLFKGDGRKEYPVAEFTNALLAENVAYIVARITGTKYFKVRAR